MAVSICLSLISARKELILVYKLCCKSICNSHQLTKAHETRIMYGFNLI